MWFSNSLKLDQAWAGLCWRRQILFAEFWVLAWFVFHKEEGEGQRPNFIFPIDAGNGRNPPHTTHNYGQDAL